MHPEFFVQLAREGLKLGLTGLDESTGQVPYVRVRVLVRSAVDQENFMVTGQSAEDYVVHPWIKASTADMATSAHGRDPPITPMTGHRAGR